MAERPAAYQVVTTLADGRQHQQHYQQQQQHQHQQQQQHQHHQLHHNHYQAEAVRSSDIEGRALVFWEQELRAIEAMPAELSAFKNADLPLARIKKIMKLEENVKGMMIAAEAPLLFSKAAEIFIRELTVRAWAHTERARRRTLQRNDIATSVADPDTDQFDFLIDIVPRETLPPVLPPTPPPPPPPHQQPQHPQREAASAASASNNGANSGIKSSPAAAAPAVQYVIQLPVSAAAASASVASSAASSGQQQQQQQHQRAVQIFFNSPPPPPPPQPGTSGEAAAAATVDVKPAMSTTGTPGVVSSLSSYSG